MDTEKDIIKIGKSHLTEIQHEVIKECLIKGTGGLSLPMGYGKTLISLIIGLEQTKDTLKPILVVASKTLIESWIFEIKKFFDSHLKYVVLHTDYIKKLDKFTLSDDIRLVLTTPEVISKYYKNEHINDYFIRQEIVNAGQFGQHFINNYNRPDVPYSTINTGGAILYSTQWGCLIVDEVQNFTKISTYKCQGIASICALHRWALSGTMFNEPIMERILGYYLIINHPSFPRSLPSADRFVKSSQFKGTLETLVYRKSNPSFIKPKVNQYTITHVLSPEEEKVYLSMKNIMKEIKKRVNEFKAMGDTINTRKFSTYLLAMITYLRQTVVCSIVPLASVAMDMTDFQNRSKLSELLSNEIDKMNLTKWLNDIESVKSSRMKKAISILEKHKYENVVVFTCFRTCLDVFRTFLPTERKILTLSSSMSSKKRAQTLDEFHVPNKNGLGNILLLTYDIGGEGLNLQKISNTVILLDFVWSDGKVSQAVARVLRYGQTAEEVNVYYLVSNTAIEQAIFEKHKLKLQIINELETGSSKTKVNKMNVNDIIRIIETEDNMRALENLSRLKIS